MAGRLATALLRTQDDERLAVLASAGHAGAFDVLVSRHARTLHAVARRVAGPDAAEDVTQQALLRAWASISGGAQVRHPSGWLHRIVTTTAIDARHAMPDDTELSDDVAADFDLPDEVQQRIDVRHALALLAALPEEQRVAVLAAVQGRTSADVADELGVSEGAVRQLAYRARAGLRAAMTAITPYPLAVWAAQRMTGEGAAVAAEAVGAGGSVLGGALLAKAGATVAVSGAVVAGITVSDTPAPDRPQRDGPAASAVAPAPPSAPPPVRFAAASAGVGSAFSTPVAASPDEPARERTRERVRRGTRTEVSRGPRQQDAGRPSEAVRSEVESPSGRGPGGKAERPRKDREGSDGERGGSKGPRPPRGEKRREPKAERPAKQRPAREEKPEPPVREQGGKGGGREKPEKAEAPAPAVADDQPGEAVPESTQPEASVPTDE